MDFELTEEQTSFKQAVIGFGQSLNDDVIERDATSTFDRETWKKCADFGLQGLPIPEEYGGQGADALSIMLAMEALGYGYKDNGLIFSLNAHMWSCEMPILRFGSEDQKQRYLPGLVDGSLIGVQGMTEPGSGSDAFSLTTSAVHKGDRYVLNGSKTFITNAPVADVFVIFATTAPGTGWAGLSAFIVDRGTPGLEIGKPFQKMGLRTSPMSELVFTDCEIPEENILRKEGIGMSVFNHSMDWERSVILASVIGTLERQIETSVSYAKQRRQFGEAIGKFQAVSHTIVDMKVRLESARLLAYQLGWLKSQGKPTAMESAMVKLVLSEAFVQSSLDALQIHGGYGYMTEYELERDVRDSLASRIYSGTSAIQKNMIARSLGL